MSMPHKAHYDKFFKFSQSCFFNLCVLHAPPRVYTWKNGGPSRAFILAAPGLYLARADTRYRAWVIPKSRGQVGRQAVPVARPHGPRLVAQKSGGALAVGQRDFCV